MSIYPIYYKVCLKFAYLLATTLFAFLPLQTNSQVIPDNTTNTQIDSNGSTAEITGGETRDTNLFHSFQDFSIQTGNEAFFNNAETINNIFSRVTGGGISNIDGLIRTNGSANFYLINPAGIVFNEGAQLDIGGSFFATTAEEIQFENSQFSAIAPEQPILTINVPIGLGFGSEPGDIIVQGAQNNVVIEIPSFRVITENIPEGIQVNPGENISLIGGDINFDGGGLQAPGGNIQLGSVNNNQDVNLIRSEDGLLNVGYGDVTRFGNISFNNAAYIDVSEEMAGNINIDGRQILVDDGSVILANTFLPSNNSIDINASESLQLKGTSGQNDFDASLDEIINISDELENGSSISSGSNIPPTDRNSNFYSISLIASDILSGSNGTGNDININSNELQVFDAAQVRTASFSNSNSFAGDINLDTQNLLIKGTNNIDGFINSLITSTTGIGTSGNGGNINISTKSLNVEDGGRIKPDTFGIGSAGNLKIVADDVTLQGTPDQGFLSTGLDANSASQGTQDSSAGNIEVNARSINILDGALITTSSFGQSMAGTITIKTEELNVVGSTSSPGFFPSGIIAAVNINETDTNSDILTSEAGSINIDANHLRVLDGARIEADTAGGNSGNININAQSIELKGTRPRVGSFIGGLSTSTRPEAFGDGGNIELTTDSLEIANGSIIQAISLGDGDGGNIRIDTETLSISGFDRFADIPVSSQRVSQINTAAQTSNGGNVFINSNSLQLDNQVRIGASTNSDGIGGEIFIDSDFVSLQNLSLINANTQGGTGGNINIDSDLILGLENSDITANAVGGNGGNIRISSNNIFGLVARGETTIQNDITASSELGIDGTIQINTPDINLQKELEQSELEFVAVDQAIANSCLARSSGKASLNVGDNDEFPKNPNSNYSDANFSSTGVGSLPANNKQSSLTQAANSRHNQSTIPAEKIVKTEDGRILLVAAPQKAESIYCQSAEEK